MKSKLSKGDKMRTLNPLVGILVLCFATAGCDKIFSSKSKATEKASKDDESEEEEETPKKKKKKSKKDKEKDSDETDKPTEKPAAIDASWVTFNDPSAGFEAKFFSTPKVEREEQDMAGMHIATVNATATDPKRLHMALRLEMTKVAQYDCTVGLKGMISQSLANMGCTPTDEKDKPINGLPGKEVSFNCTGADKPQRGQMRVLCDARGLKAGRILAYSTMAAYLSDWNAEETTAFLDSFKPVSPK